MHKSQHPSASEQVLIREAEVQTLDSSPDIALYVVSWRLKIEE
jgi:hypothetical protein